MKTKDNKPEILAPAGNMEALKAAVNAKADAVYLGGRLFGARAYADNFDEKELLEGMDFCHLFDTNVYMTVNTLLKEDEITRLKDYMRPYYEHGLDGAIVQDLGVARVLKDEFPELPLHASTQMSISSSYGAKLLKEFGFKRIVPARELSLKEICTIKEQADIEVETFVHGAMCFAYSGKCLLSSFSGGRSGNRGRCAQPCRMYYEKDDGKGGHIMSLKDMCTLSYVPMLCDFHIDSLKIEGRMKNPGYVASAVYAYRKVRDLYIDENESKEKLQKEIAVITEELNDIFNRGGFSKGYYMEARGRDMLSLDRPNHNGLLVGKVKNISGSDVNISLSKNINKKDVLEIRTKKSKVEITSNVDAKALSEVSLKGRELRYISKGDEVYRTRNNKLLEKIEREILENERKLEVSVSVTCKIDKPMQINMKSLSGTHEVSVSGQIINQAETKKTETDDILQKLKKTTGSNIEIKKINIELSKDAFVPMSEFNHLRRKAVNLYKQKIIDNRHR